ncbi:type I methionyl aminopeptidase [Candidatus Saccharibacteria bacterium]|nr:type I methionyl aminopeptidase [Candidatus Saccharibacteria bacterium]
MININNSSKEKLAEKITAMREGGKILGNLLKDLKAYVQPGMTGKEIDAWVRSEIVKRGAKVSYDMLDEEFPGSICISINDQLVHGAPSDEVLEVGDKVSFDLVIYYKGYHTDSAFTMLVGGEGSPAVKKMISVTESSLWEGIEQVKPGAHIGDIGHAVEAVLRKGHLGVIENYVGHGIDKEMHDKPEVPNYGRKGHGYKLVEGDTIAIEPMSCLGKPANYVDKDDNWSVKMKDGSIGCHCEHTILVTHDGYEVLTLADD